MPSIDHVLETSLYFDDLTKARDFYERVFKLTPMFTDDRLCAYAIGNTVLLLFLRGSTMKTVTLPGGTIPPHDGKGGLHVAFAVAKNELAAWEATLAEHGVTIEGRTKWPKGSESIYFRDPGGHLLELATPKLWTNY